MGTRTTGSNFRVITTSYGIPSAFAARSLILRVYSEENSGGSTNKESPSRRVQSTSGSVTTDRTLSVGPARYNLRLMTKLLPPGAVIEESGAGVGPVIEPELVVAVSDVTVPRPGVPVPWPAVSVL